MAVLLCDPIGCQPDRVQEALGQCLYIGLDFRWLSEQPAFELSDFCGSVQLETCCDAGSAVYGTVV